ncbi:MAG: GDSL-type esterase/lipase family protein [Clostridia bacterium]|nr:GDSL-type esterase/lipase family protein [Clostridia bacterium]
MQTFIPAKDNSSPVRVFGLAPYADGEGFSKCHKSILDAVPTLKDLGHRSCGGRICFRTDADHFTLRMTLERVSVDIGIAIFGASSADVYEGDRTKARFLGLLYPTTSYSDTPAVVERTFYRALPGMQDITVVLPRNETVTEFSVSVEDGCRVEAPTPYRNQKPVIFYGSSITEGGCPTRVGCNYVSLLSNLLNIDIRNYGFSGNAKGELAFADYIIAQDPCIFVYDYDHNAPTPKWLEDTHEPFFKRIRAALPDLPIIMMSRPDFTRDEDAAARRAIIKKTYENAVSAGDKLVRFLDGGEFFPPELVDYCSVDNVHPNDMGFRCMADKAAPVLEEFAAWLK